MNGTPKIEKFELAFADTEPRDHDQLWVDTLRSVYDISLDRENPRKVARVGRSWMLDRLVLNEAVFGGQLIRRDKRHLRLMPNDLLLVEIYLDGELFGDLDGAPVHIVPGEVHILDFSRTYVARSRQTHVRSLLVSQDAVGYDPRRHGPVVKITKESVVGHILFDTLMRVFDQLDRISEQEAKAVSNVIVSLLETALNTDLDSVPDTPGFKTARTQAVRAYINENLTASTVSPDALGARFGVSRATLYRAFKDDGGIERYVLARRLDAALSSLARSPSERGAVARTAEHWGFSSASYFSREFKRRFGFSPTEITGSRNDPLARSDVDVAIQAPTMADRYTDFLRKL
ncbi:MAG: helix-turn-helix domain-containing protein [Pseudomonadota bacterium]